MGAVSVVAVFMEAVLIMRNCSLSEQVNLKTPKVRISALEFCILSSMTTPQNWDGVLE